ncbi:D-alanine--D-alanine ligase [Nocardioides sp. ChNu-153]|uniref:D-alanine--D-alanine ligase family protein n=1 Tax=unclassified Nocardioides TaxID=2615069 RepID=UPI0024062E23|nr:MULTISPECIES: D-alanine--D-alanine ligase family protein [unclassified Nocardioides]MDF9716945.1 D-alanine--D-alanine ligase [Nocardioides sp. ChNu-99]MDN7122650.1 D-alanine--D-alanine ligase [Nocardioides sp. ChNu-153]
MSESAPRRPRVAVVFGGRSAEHSISCISAGSVIAALDPEQYDVVPVGIATDGRWVLEDPSLNRLELGPGGALPQVRGDAAVQLTPGATPELVVRDAGDVPRVLGEVDVVFPVMHGPFGQDGTLQGLLEMAGVRYVGAGVLSSAVGTDKVYMKRLFEAAGLPVLPWVAITPRDWARDEVGVRERVAALGLPVFVKPARAGSSFGITRVDDLADLDAALAEARRHDPKVLVEAAAVGAREVECGVLAGEGAGDHTTSALAEIRVTAEHSFYDFEAKYLPEENTALDVPADVPDEVAARVQELSVAAFDALDCEGLARVDFFVMPDGRVVLNEVETMPGFTSLSMFPRMWAASGIDYPTLVDRLVRGALARDTGLR